MTEAVQNIIPFMKKENRELCILVVEDDRIERTFMEQQINDLGHRMIPAENGQHALEMLVAHEDEVDIILMDRIMPVMDGLTAVRKIKERAEFRKIPIVMVTGSSSSHEIKEGIDAGVFYYLTKPVNDDVLKSVLSAAVREVKQYQTLSEELKRHRTSFNLIHTCKFTFHTIEEAESLCAFMAHCFPDPDRALPGLAELLFNAIEHGTYDIGYDRKSELIEAGTLRAEIVRRQGLKEYEGRVVEALITRKEDGVYAVITDQGKGFDWKKFMTIEPSRATDNHGRGIAQARAISFDRLTYNETGNQAIGFVSGTQDLKW